MAAIRKKLADAYIALLDLRTSGDVTIEEYKVLDECSMVIVNAVTPEEWDYITERVEPTSWGNETPFTLFKIQVILVG